MCFFKSGGSSGSAAAPSAEVKEESAAKKGRLLFTDGQNKGQQLNSSQGASIRKVFGNG